MEDEPDLFRSAWLKWGWASAHAEVLKSDTRDFTQDTQRHGELIGRSRYYPKRHCIIAHAERVPHFPDRLGLILGDVVHDFRSCLNHLAWVLATRAGGITAKNERDVQFPLCKSLRDFNNAYPINLPKVGRTDIAKVRRYQPYKAGKRNLSRHPYTTLAKLSNDDKHRVIQPVWALPRGYRYKITGGWDCTVTRIPLTLGLERLEVGTEVARVYVRKTGPNPRIEMEGAVSVEPYINELTSLVQWLDLTSKMTAALLREFVKPPKDLLDTIAPLDREHVFP